MHLVHQRATPSMPAATAAGGPAALLRGSYVGALEGWWSSGAKPAARGTSGASDGRGGTGNGLGGVDKTGSAGGGRKRRLGLGVGEGFLDIAQKIR